MPGNDIIFKADNNILSVITRGIERLSGELEILY